MRVLMLSWEYPPLVVGGLGRHVEALARELAARGHDVRVVTRGTAVEPVAEQRDGVRVARAALDPIAVDFTTESLLAWAQVSEHAMLRAALPLIAGWRPDVLHAHDWLVAQTAVTLAEATGAPLVTTIHATEGGRHQGWLPQPLNRAIHSLERWLAARSDHLIVCSTAMRDETRRLFALDDDRPRVAVVPNGIDAARWRATPAARRAARTQLGPDGPLLVYAGRLVHEKGVRTVLETLRPLREAHPNLRLAIAGTGPCEDELRAHGRTLRVARAVQWLGFVADDRLPAVLGAADAVIVPSLYEPFGIVALEAAAAGAPLVLADTGGLSDLIGAGLAARSFAPGDAGALTNAIGKVLADPVAARRIATRAARTVRSDYGWAAVARQTESIYRDLVDGRARAGTAAQDIVRRSLTTRAGTPTDTL